MTISKLELAKRKRKALDEKIARLERQAQDEFATQKFAHVEARWRPDREKWTVRRNGGGAAHIAECATKTEAVGLANRINAIIESIVREKCNEQSQ